MKHGYVKAAAAAPKIRVADPEYNAQVICGLLDGIFERGAKLIVLPELCLTGYTCGDLFLQERLLSETLTGLKKVIAHTAGKDALVFAGLPFEKGNRLYNVAAAIHNGRLLALIPKRSIPNYAEFYEARHFEKGTAAVESVPFDGVQVPFGGSILFECENMPGFVAGCEICEDVWDCNPPSTAHVKAGASVIVNLSASNETVGKNEYRGTLVVSTSARLVAGYVYASAGEGESTQDLVFSGHSMIAENGTVLAEAKRFTNETIETELDIDRLRHERRRMNTFPAAQDDGYLRIPFSIEKEDLVLTRSYSPLPFVPSDDSLRKKRCEEILSIQAYGLKKRLEHTGSRAAVIGVSGGLDSTLALLVTARAWDMLGLERSGILSVTMPCFGTTDRTYINACKLARGLKTTLREINIRESVTVHFQDIGQDGKNHDVTFENSQARERTQVLMDLANKERGLVIGTGDMSELALGWATYNGDHMSMYGVNAGVPKTLVRHLVQYYADTCEDREITEVLQDVLATPVSPELLPPVDGTISQKTEDLVGPYELHDFFLYYMLRCGFPPKKLYRIAVKAFAGQYEEETVKKWLKTFYSRFFSQQFKRSCLPDGPKVGSVALSPRGDLRMPSDASPAAWMKELSEL